MLLGYLTLSVETVLLNKEDLILKGVKDTNESTNELNYYNW